MSRIYHHRETSYTIMEAARAAKVTEEDIQKAIDNHDLWPFRKEGAIMIPKIELDTAKESGVFDDLEEQETIECIKDNPQESTIKEEPVEVVNPITFDPNINSSMLGIINNISELAKQNNQSIDIRISIHPKDNIV